MKTSNYNQKIDAAIKAGKLIPWEKVHEQRMKTDADRKRFEKVYKEMDKENQRLLKLELAQKVKQARALSGMTQQELADRIHTTKSYISLVENGKQNITVEFVVKVATALGRRVEIEIY